MEDVNREQVEIMKHTLICPGHLYCGDSEDMQDLIQRGFMEFAGRKSFVPDPYFRITPAGNQFLLNRPAGEV